MSEKTCNGCIFCVGYDSDSFFVCYNPESGRRDKLVGTMVVKELDPRGFLPPRSTLYAPACDLFEQKGARRHPTGTPDIPMVSCWTEVMEELCQELEAKEADKKGDPVMGGVARRICIAMFGTKSDAITWLDPATMGLRTRGVTTPEFATLVCRGRYGESDRSMLTAYRLSQEWWFSLSGEEAPGAQANTILSAVAHAMASLVHRTFKSVARLEMELFSFPGDIKGGKSIGFAAKVYGEKIH